MKVVWTYKDKPILSHDDLHPLCTWFVYELEFTDGTKYIGQKKVRTTKELPLLKNGNKRPNHIKFQNRNRKGKRVTLEVISINKKFDTYEGSSEENKGKTVSNKLILFQTKDSKASTYLEADLLFRNEVLFTDKYNNKNILSSFYDNSLEGLIYD